MIQRDYFVTRIFAQEVGELVQKGWEFRGKGKWLDPIRKWLWKRWSAPYFKQTISYKEINVQEKRFVDLVCNAIASAHLHPDKVEMVIVGPESLNMAMSAPEACRTFEFVTEIGCDRPLRLLGIRIRMVPWCKEILVIPKA